jgi:hypothetical protein
MPVTKKRPITWKCLNCNVTFTSEDKEYLKTEGFEHQKNVHDLFEENREYFMNGHWGNYYDIS